MTSSWTGYARRAAGEDFARGVADCGSFAGGWAALVCGTWPRCGILRRPVSDRDALAYLRTQGGLAAVVAAGLEPLGWRLVEDAQDFDIVVADCPEAFRGETVGVMRAGSLITKSEAGGLFLLPKPKLKGVWRWES